MERAIAERGRHPTVNVLRSISRTMPGCVPGSVRPTLEKARELMSLFADMEELIRLGAYRKGSDPKVGPRDAINPVLEAFLSQQREERTRLPTATSCRRRSSTRRARMPRDKGADLMGKEYKS
jgi:flagellum-specific ATP synthase